MLKYFLNSACFLLAFSFSNTDSALLQNNDPKATAVLNKVQAVYANLEQYGFEVDYKSYGTYEDKEILENYKGKILKKGKTFYSKIQNTIFLSDTKKALKAYSNDKVIEVYESGIDASQVQNPAYLDGFLKHYKYKEVKESKTHYICTLQTAAITQMPYGKIVLFINKKDYTISRQELYLLARLPYIKKSGERKIGNPRIDIEFSTLNKKLSKSELKNMQIDSYIKVIGKTIKPSSEYKEYTIEKI